MCYVFADMQEKIIFVFPGQGAQYIGMGADVWHDFAVARYTFQEVSDIAKRDMAHICFHVLQIVLIYEVCQEYG